MPQPDLSALVASRICHDLAGPMGAISNGVELLGLTGGGEGEETALIAESVAEANARLRLFRIAFGRGECDVPVASREIREILAALSPSGRIARRWRPESDPSRAEARAVLLAMMCLETALRGEGTITAEGSAGGYRIAAEGPEIDMKKAPWRCLEGGDPPEALPAAQVEFALLTEAARVLGRDIALASELGRVTISF